PLKRGGRPLLLIVAFALGAAVMRYYDTRQATSKVVQAPLPSTDLPATAAPEPPRSVNVNFAREPLWAYGFTEPAKAGDKAQPQAPPTSKPRPNEDLDEQMRPRQAEGSTASYSVVQIRDLHNVIDWFPADHPKMPYVIEHGPA